VKHAPWAEQVIPVQGSDELVPSEQARQKAVKIPQDARVHPADPPEEFDRQAFVKQPGDMRTTVSLPPDLVEEARRLLGCTSKTEAVIVSLRDLVRRRRTAELIGLLGAVDLEIDIPASRRRPRRTRQGRSPS
jgi:Arc/MetJ family transcription regulator